MVLLVIIKSLLLLGLWFESVESAIVFGFGRCPSVTTKSDFVSTTYLGKWYEYERFNNWFERDLKCVYAQYTSNGDGSIGVTNGGIKKSNGEDSTIEGKATVPDSSKPGELKVTFSNLLDFIGGANYLVLDTDYATYALVFSCSNIPLVPVTIQTAWILTRTRGVAPSNLRALKTTLDNYGIPSNKLKVIDQNGCSN